MPLSPTLTPSITPPPSSSMFRPSPTSRLSRASEASEAITQPIHIYFGGDTSRSPENSDSDGSDSTLEDTDLHPDFGYPLQRMPSAGLSIDSLSRDYRGSFSSCSSESDCSTSSSIAYDMDFEALVDGLIAENSFPHIAQHMVMVEPSSPTSRDSVMIRSLPRTSPELYLLLELNHREARQDPWNPIPHILCAVERDDRVFLCMERLVGYNQPPMQTVANYIDFFRQILEGLAFLHEHNIVQLSCSDPSSYMVDLSSGPASPLLQFATQVSSTPTNASCLSQPETKSVFDRTRYPVKYYFTNLSRSHKVSSITSTSGSEAARGDIRDCGVMIDRLLVDVPHISPKLKSLVKAMTSGAFGADDARKLFEALCKSIESSVFEFPVGPGVVPERMTKAGSGSLPLPGSARPSILTELSFS